MVEVKNAPVPGLHCMAYDRQLSCALRRAQGGPVLDYATAGIAEVVTGAGAHLRRCAGAGAGAEHVSYARADESRSEREDDGKRS